MQSSSTSRLSLQHLQKTNSSNINISKDNIVSAPSLQILKPEYNTYLKDPKMADEIEEHKRFLQIKWKSAIRVLQMVKRLTTVFRKRKVLELAR